MPRPSLVRFPACLLALAFLTVFSAPARAQGFVSPLIGYNFGGDAGCPEITDCEDKKLNLGIAFGSLGPVAGFEAELAYARDFFGAGPGLQSNVLTFMLNIMIAPKIGPVRPYVAAGAGLIKQKIELTSEDLLDTSNNDLGWDWGFGAMGFFTDNFGVRGDIRFFRTFNDVELFGVTIENEKLDFGRASGAVVFLF